MYYLLYSEYFNKILLSKTTITRILLPYGSVNHHIISKRKQQQLNHFY